MLKKHGQICQHSVPEYSGRLTDAEFAAYNAVFASIEGDFKELVRIADGLGQLEKSMPSFLEKLSSPRLQSLTGQDGSEWKILAPLPVTPSGEMLWCKRQFGEMEEFAVVERFDPSSPLAMAQGEFDVQMTDSDPLRLLRDFINARRDAAQLFANDIIAAAKEQVTENHPGEDLNRVLDAISQRCTKSISAEERISSSQARRQGEGMHV
jgi:hypothetical protein